jgi:hypothetical protein
MVDRRRRYVETLDYLAAVRRMMRAAGRRVADADEAELAELLAIRAEVDEAIDRAVAGWRAQGRSWAIIGAAAGMSKQAAFKRWASTDG